MARHSAEEGYKATDVAENILYLCGKNGIYVSPMKLLKLVFISHGWMLGLHGRPLISEEVEAWVHGPVVKVVYKRYKRYRNKHIPKTYSKDHSSAFAPEANRIMEQVTETHGNLSSWQLSGITHRDESPWGITVMRSGLNSVIADDDIEQYYRSVHNGQQNY